jgi:hypothetical protein
MAKKKAKSKTAEKKTAKKKSTPKMPRTKKQINPAEVRNDIAKIVKSGAKKIARAVMSQAITGQLAPAKYLFEVAEIYPPSTDGSHATAEEDCLAKTLLHRLNIPDEPIARDEEDEPKATIPADKPAAKPAGEDEGKDSGSEPEAGDESKDSMLV